MARRNGNEETQTLTDSDMGEADNALVPGDAGAIAMPTFDELLQHGFTAVKKMKIGDPKNGGIVAYAGQLLRQGNPITTRLPGVNKGDDDIEGELPTWICHPAVLARGEDGGIEFKVQEAVTHIIITPHQLNADFGQLYSKIYDFEHDKLKAVGLFATRWVGKESIKGGARSLNMFDWREKVTALAA